MRIAALYDIHGNLPALEAVLSEVILEKPDLVIVGGDVVPGPMPSGCLALLRGLDAPLQAIKGNCETEVLAAVDGGRTGRVPDRFMPVIEWSAAQLSKKDIEWMRSWPATIQTGRALFCHATPRDDNEVFLYTTDETKLQGVFPNGIVVCGHTHMQFDRRIGSSRVVNAGSVGSPYGRPGAYWAFIDEEVALKRTAYDTTSAAEQVRRTEFPDAETFAQESILAPRSEEDMRARFSKIEIGSTSA